MKANELRIGNYIYIDSRDELRTIVEIRHTMVSVKYIRSDTNQPHQSMVEYDRLTPITLTEEWLLKFGFAELLVNHGKIKDYRLNCTPPGYKHEYFFVFRFRERNDEDFRMYWYPQATNGSMHTFPCKYVHQLQNLFFALTGEELTLITELSQIEK